MRLGKLEFTPGRWPTVVTLLLLMLLLWMGFWQLDRAREKRALLEDFQVTTGEIQIKLEAGMRPGPDLQHQAAVATGRYDAAHQFLLDNKTHEGHVGYQVLTPLLLDTGDAALLVNRGWIPMGAGRAELPDPQVSTQRREVSGRIRIPRQDSFMLGEEEPRSGWPYRVQRAELAHLQQQLDYRLLPVILLLDAQQPDGYVRVWDALPFGPERNVGYAVQWFGLALALLIIFLAVNTRRID